MRVLLLDDPHLGPILKKHLQDALPDQAPALVKVVACRNDSEGGLSRSWQRASCLHPVLCKAVAFRHMWDTGERLACPRAADCGALLTASAVVNMGACRLGSTENTPPEAGASLAAQDGLLLGHQCLSDL